MTIWKKIALNVGRFIINIRGVRVVAHTFVLTVGIL